jgi:alpha-tubulin suppressor-like RCC1 family protein
MLGIALVAGIVLGGCGGQADNAGDAGSADHLAPSMKRMPLVMVDSNRISAGCDDVLALRIDGSVFFWGIDRTGMRGVATPLLADTPYPVPRLHNIVSVKAGCGHGVALGSDGSVWTWGANDSGQLGNGTFTSSIVPTQVAGIADVKAISAGYDHTIALKMDGTVWCWGSCNLGPADAFLTVPTMVPNINNVAQVAAAQEFTVMSKTDGTVWSWGTEGFPGDGTTGWALYPVQALSLNDAKSLGAGAYSSNYLILQGDGTVWGWGCNRSGDLGVASPFSFAYPIRLTGLSDVKAVSTQFENSAAVTFGGAVYVWGGNAEGQLGIGTLALASTPVPTKFMDPGDAVAVAAGYDFTIVLNRDGSVYGAGQNYGGQLANNSLYQTVSPTQVVGVGGVGFLSLGVSTAP